LPALALLLACAGCGKKESPVKTPVKAPVKTEKPAPQKKPERPAPARLLLTQAGGGADGAVLLRLCVWPNPGQTAGVPDQVEFWKTSNRWANAYAKLETEISVVKTGKVETLYRVAPAARLAGGEKIKAAVHWGTNRVESGPVVIDRPPTGAVDRLQAEFDSAMLTGDYAAALNVASNRIQLDEKAYEGYWMAGLAHEGLANREAARQACQRALELYPPSTRERLREPPVVLRRKLENLDKQEK
jgi:tetratricopeptide (TPR) repeat protein